MGIIGQAGCAGRHCVRCLVRAGAKVDEANAMGQTALHHAAQEGHLEVVQCAAARHLAAELGLQGCQQCLLDTALTTQ